MMIDAQSKFGYWGQVAARQATRTEQPTDASEDEELEEKPAAADWEE